MRGEVGKLHLPGSPEAAPAGGYTVQKSALDDIPQVPSGKSHFTISDVPLELTSGSQRDTSLQEKYAGTPRKAKILFIVDSPNWALDFNTDNIIRVLGNSYDMCKRYKTDVTAFNVDNADLVVVYYWKEFKDPNMQELSGVFGRNRHKLLLGICSHLELQGKFREAGLKILRQLGHAIFVNSRLLYKEFANLFDVPVFYTPNGVDTQFFTPGGQKGASKSLRVGWAGSLTNNGNIRGVYDFIVPAVNSVEGTELVVAAREHKWRNLEQMREFYRSLDVYICASQTESGPNPCLEAAACGVPLVTTRVGVMPELVQNGLNGLFVERDIQDIAEKLKLLRDNPDLRAKLSQAMLESINEWDWRKKAVNYRRMFDAVLLSRIETAVVPDKPVAKASSPKLSVVPLYEARGNPLVSVWMAAYNAADYIARAIESVLIQNYRNFELIIVDDGSTDRTADIVRSFKDEPIKYFFKEHGGLASVRNFQIRKSSGSFIVILDSDDMMMPDCIARHLQVFERHPEVDMVYCDDCCIDEEDRPISKMNKPEYSDQNALISDLFRWGWAIVPFRTCIRKSVFDKIGYYDERLIVSEDYDMVRRFISHGLKMRHLPAALYLRRLRANSLSRSLNAAKAKSHFEVVRRFTETFTAKELFPNVRWDKLAAEQKPLLAKCKTALVYLGIGEQYLGSNAPDFAEAAFEMACEQLEECCKIEPANPQVSYLLEKCRLIRATHLPSDRRPVCQPV